VPFTLGFVVENDGYGTANSLQITSGQPDIIATQHGLLVNFMFISAMIGNGSINPSLTVMFGDIQPGVTKVARWQMISRLQGESRNYSATFENINPLGDTHLSILDELKIHELIRNVKIYVPDEEDEVLDFLVNEHIELLTYPDALYSSKSLQRYDVTTGSVLSVQRLTSGLLEVRTRSNNMGWIYYRYEETEYISYNTSVVVNVTKQEDNCLYLVPSENAWITKKRNVTTNTIIFTLHIIDNIIGTGEVVFFIQLCSDFPTVERNYTVPMPGKLHIL